MIPSRTNMSAAPTDSVARQPAAGLDALPAEPKRAKVLESSITGPTIVVLIAGLVWWWPSIAQSALWMIPWLLLVTATELLPVYYTDQVNLTLSMPLLLAVGMTLGPVPAGVLGFCGAWDKRLFRGEITWARAFFNRSQIALASLLAAVTFQVTGGTVDQWPGVIGPCVAAVAVDIVVNVALVSVVAMLAHYKSFQEIARGVVLDNPLLFVTTYVGLIPL